VANQGNPQDVVSHLISRLISQVLSDSAVYNPGPSISSNVVDPSRMFWVMFVCGNISRCQGCNQKTARGPDGRTPLMPPGDLVVQLKEQVSFQNPKTENYQVFHDFCNVSYHARMACITKPLLVCSTFTIVMM